MEMDEAIETDRETIETDEKMANSQQPTIEQDPKNQHACTNDSHEFLWSADPTRFES